MVEKKREENHTLGLALGGGAVLGASHIGILQAFEEHDIQPDYISGTSIGALVAAFYAFGVPVGQMKEVALELDWLDISSIHLSKMGLLSNKKLRSVLGQHIGQKNIEEAEIPLAMVSTDLSSGQKVILRKGDLANGVMASSCIPGIFAPIEYDGRMLVDGALVENVPVSPLQQMGAGRIVAVDVNSLRAYEKPTNILEVITNALDIAIESLSRINADKVDLLIQPELSSFSRTEIGKDEISALIERGYQKGCEVLSHQNL